MEDKFKISRIMKAAKAISILSIITAHLRDSENIVSERLGSIGVIVFIFIAGYYFHPKKYNTLRSFFQKKATTIIIPWVFTGSILYIIENQFSLPGLFNWLIGNGSYLYYLTILMLCYLVLFYLRSRVVLIALIFINILSQVLTAFGIIDHCAFVLFGMGPVNNYLNLFNWIGYFALGVMAKEIPLDSLFYRLKQMIWIILPGYVLLLAGSLLLEPDKGGYFSKLAIPMQLAGVLTVFAFASVRCLHRRWVYRLSDLTFAIYLTHFFVFPIRRFLPTGVPGEVLNPFLILIIVSGLLYLGQRISRLLSLEKLYTLMLGIRG